MKLHEIVLLESKQPGEYVYHASYLPNLRNGLKSILKQGLLPSVDGYGGAGVYFAYNPQGTYQHVDISQATMFRVKWADLLNKFGTYPQKVDGIQRDEDEIVVPGVVPVSMLQVELYKNEWWEVEDAYEHSRGR